MVEKSKYLRHYNNDVFFTLCGFVNFTLYNIEYFNKMYKFRFRCYFFEINKLFTKINGKK